MNVDENEMVSCPYCWQQIEISVDCTVDQYSFIEDCHVCCRPIHFTVRVDTEGVPTIEAMTDND